MNFKPTHELTDEEGKATMVMLVEGCAYRGHEWAESMAADITYDGSWKIRGEPMNVSARPAPPEEPDDHR